MVMMFKILVLQRSYNMSDDQTEYQLNDRITFMRFVGLGLGDRIFILYAFLAVQQSAKNMQ
jgi:IS5 family transposase